MSASWLEGTLVSASALHHTLADCALGPQEDTLARAVLRCRPVLRRASLQLGPATGAGAVWRVLASPLVSILGWRHETVSHESIGTLRVQVACLVGIDSRTSPRRTLLVTLPWGVLPGPVARAVARRALEYDVRWAMVTNGQVWRWLDARRPLGRQFTGLRLAAAHADERVWEAFWLMGQASDGHQLDTLDQLTRELETTATTAIRAAVADVRRRLARQLRATDDEVLTHVFRWLFLLFAEARGLLPMQNPVYRESYAISTLARYARQGVSPFNLWEALQASARLAHTGSRHPLLTVTPLNGALFAPGGTPRADRHRLQDTTVGPMLDALTTVSSDTRRTSVSFADLDVEHLGTIYEDVLAGTPGLVRKQTGTFYTPRDLADVLVADTLAPLVAGRTADEILALRIVDPAAGSGAILASAARYLMGAIEAAWVRDGLGGPLDISPSERADVVRRLVEQCLYGVDVHGRAVQVARLSLWLASMTRDRPLTFLDHHLRVGNSLIGTTPADVLARRPGVTARPGRTRQTTDGRQLTLFDLDAWDRQAGALALALTRISGAPSDTAADVHAKTHDFHAIQQDALLRRWKQRADLWCGAWMHESALADGVWTEIDRQARDATTSLPALGSLAGTLAERAREAACFHWPLEFPEIFHARDDPGFDAVLANPPWEVLRADLGSESDRASSRVRVRREQQFLSRCGFYSAGTTGHRNLYQLFVERMLRLCRSGGRLGVLAPWGLLTEQASAGTRQRLFSSAAVDKVTVFDNKRRIFPIHRSVRFAAVTATRGPNTRGLTLRISVTAPGALAQDDDGTASLWVDEDLIKGGDPEGLALPGLRSATEAHALTTMLASGPRLREAPWALSFGREFNATDDRGILRQGVRRDGRLIVVGGRHVRPFAVDLTDTSTSVSVADARRRLPLRPWTRWRLAYRDVASSTNRLSLIAAPLPPDVLSTHTVFVARQHLPARRLLYLCGVLNSFVANWFVRLYMGTHVTSALLGRLPVPAPDASPALTRRIARLTAQLRRCQASEVESSSAYIELQVAVGRLYGLRPAEVAAIVETFPLVDERVRARVVSGAA